GSTVEGVSFDDGAGAVVGFRPLGATMVEPVVGSVPDQVVYANVWPNVDLVYTVTGAGVRENIVLKAPGAPGSFRFALRSASGALALGAVRGSLVSSVLGDGALPADVGVGVSATVLARRADGSMVPAGPGAKTVVFDPPLVLTGTRGTPAVEAHPSLAQAVPGTVSVGVDPGWLAAQPASAYPIDLDPSIGGNLPSSIYNYKADGYSCACGIGTMVGNSTSPTSTDYWRSVVAYPDLTTLNGTVILAAQLQSEYGGQGTRDQYVAYAHWASAFSYAGAANGGALASGIYGGGVWGDSGLTAQVQGWANTGSYGAFGFMGTETPGLYTYQTLNIWLYVAYA
ncbi:MAG: hypothetical protein ACRDX8_15345, partial [Acidimicrobiales bacterium]